MAATTGAVPLLVAASPPTRSWQAHPTAVHVGPGVGADLLASTVTVPDMAHGEDVGMGRRRERRRGGTRRGRLVDDAAAAAAVLGLGEGTCVGEDEVARVRIVGGVGEGRAAGQIAIAGGGSPMAWRGARTMAAPRQVEAAGSQRRLDPPT